MNCNLVQRRLLETENLTRLDSQIKTHLGRCAACREWRARLAQIEKNVPYLPVPSNKGPGKVLQRLKKAPLPASREARKASSPLHRYGSWLIAASILFLFGGWWVLQNWLVPIERSAQPKSGLMPDPLVANLVQRDLRLAESNLPHQRIETLADLADDLSQETQKLAGQETAGNTELVNLARLYERVIQNGIIRRAQSLPPSERHRVLDPIAHRLARVGRDAENLARDFPHAADPLHLIAQAANQGNGRLLGFVKEATP